MTSVGNAAVGYMEGDLIKESAFDGGSFDPTDKDNYDKEALQAHYDSLDDNGKSSEYGVALKRLLDALNGAGEFEGLGGTEQNVAIASTGLAFVKQHMVDPTYGEGKSVAEVDGLLADEYTRLGAAVGLSTLLAPSGNPQADYTDPEAVLDQLKNLKQQLETLESYGFDPSDFGFPDDMLEQLDAAIGGLESAIPDAGDAVNPGTDGAVKIATNVGATLLAQSKIDFALASGASADLLDQLQNEFAQVSGGSYINHVAQTEGAEVAGGTQDAIAKQAEYEAKAAAAQSELDAYVAGLVDKGLTQAEIDIIENHSLQEISENHPELLVYKGEHDLLKVDIQLNKDIAKLYSEYATSLEANDGVANEADYLMVNSNIQGLISSAHAATSQIATVVLNDPSFSESANADSKAKWEALKNDSTAAADTADELRELMLTVLENLRESYTDALQAVTH